MLDEIQIFLQILLVVIFIAQYITSKTENKYIKRRLNNLEKLINEDEHKSEADVICE
jgi:hypothetical protein